MRIPVSIVLGLLLLSGMAAGALAQSDTVQYVPKYYDPVIEALEDRADSLRAIDDSITEEIRERQKARKEQEKDERKELRFDVSGIPRPASPDAFETVFHFPPVAQYRTGTCWSFGATSFLESEVARISGREVKLSEIHTVYHEYVEKARHYIRERGDRMQGQGSEANAVFRMMQEYGAVPLEEYPGLINGQTRHDHAAMSKEVREYLAFVKEHDYWDEESVLDHVRLILDKHIGKPPVSFEFEGKQVTPREFVNSGLKLDFDDYVGVISTSSIPYYTQGEFEVPDNWWHDSSYYNLPLDEWYGALKSAIQEGYTMVLAGDISEPGWYGHQDVSVVPDFDIPQDHINQDAREYRFYNRSTTDDHLVHLVGHTTVDGRDWFLIKDSGRSARWGQFEGYSFMRDDYVRLKMLAFWVHRDAVVGVLERFK